jgi:flavin-dependent dehydrogenase
MTSSKHIVIVGGGTAGWMAANLMAHQWIKLGFKISLIESTKIGTVGVGEGSTPFLKEFFQTLNIPEKVWMPACNATYKCGIRFPDWSTVNQQNSYFHPFYSDIDSELAKSFFQQCNLKRAGESAFTNPDDYFVTSALANNRKAPKSTKYPDDSLTYGYHFDAELLGAFLKQHAIHLGVSHINDSVTKTIVDRNGDIAILQTQEHGVVRGDFFVDCSGFKGLLIQDVLGESLISCKNHLYNDSAVAIPTPHEHMETMPCETVSKALKYGWVWHIPLMNRMGNGYVYCSDYISKEQAEEELRELLGEQAVGQPARHLHWQPGRIEQHWKNNCIAIGLSQGFLEPLEAPMLYIVQRSIEGFIEHYQSGGFSNKNKQIFNDEINNIIDGTRDYLQAHYKVNTRTDTQYWIDNRNNTSTSPILDNLLLGWQQDSNFDEIIHDHMPHLAYLKTSWYCLLAGKGYFSNIHENKLVNNKAAKINKEVKALCQKKSGLFQDHWQYLNSNHSLNSALKPKDISLK